MEIKYELEKNVHPCGDCVNYGDENCMVFMSECEWANLKEDNNGDN